MKQTYNDIEITYVEGDNRWHFELCGRQRSAESLAKAKEAIDKEPVEKRKQVFPRFEAYRFQYNRDPIVVTVTSITDLSYGGSSHSFWILNAKKERAKELASSLFPVNEKNTAIVAEIKRLTKEIEVLEEKKSRQHAKLEPATIPKELA